jgi:hypothetical protein
MKPISERQRNLLRILTVLDIETDITKRWEEGIDHHETSCKTMDLLMDIDWLLCGDYFGWKKGGDGDNGETLMYQLDIMFELQDILNGKTQ